MRGMLRRLSPRAYALLAVNAVVALGLAREMWQGTETRTLLDTPPRRGLTLPSIPVENSRTTALGTIQERALFHSTRRFFVAIDPHTLPAIAPRPDYELVGTLIIPRKPAVALLKQHATGVSRKVKPGDDLDGWMVEAVESSRVVVRYQDNRAEITRSEPEKGKGAIAGAVRIAPLVRASERLSMSQLRALGNGGSTVTSSAASESTGGRPRVYRPPP